MTLVKSQICLFILCLSMHLFATLPQSDGYFTGADGYEIYFRTVGTGNETVVFLHGGPGFDMHDGGYELDALAQGRRLIIYDQRGGGDSDLVFDPADLEADDHVADLEALRQHFQLDKLTLLGQSWGSGLATLYAIEYPQNVERMILMSPMPMRNIMSVYRGTLTNRLLEPEELARFIEILGTDWDAISDQEVLALCEEYIPIIFKSYLTGPGTLDQMNGDYCAARPEAQRRRWWNNAVTSASFAGFDWRQAATQIPVPVLVFDGDLTAVPKNTTREWANYYPNSRLFFLPNSGHLTWLDNPTGLIAELNRFLLGVWPSIARRADVLELDMLAQYNFDGDIDNNSDFYHHGSSSGNISYVADRFTAAGKAISFANNAKITVPNPEWTPVATHWSWSTWVRVKSNNSRDLLNQGDVGILALDQSYPVFTLGDVTLTSPTQLQKKTWHHLAVVRDGNDFHLYQDGNLVASQTSANPTDLIGDFTMTNNKGQLDDVRIYARSLSANDATALYNYVHD